MESIEQIFFRKVNPSDFRNMYSVAVPSSGGGQTYIEAAGISDNTLMAFLDYAELIAPTSKQETRMAFRFNCYKIADAEQYDFIEFQPRRGRNYRIVRQTEAHRHPAWREESGFPVPPKNADGSYVDDTHFTGIIDNLLIVIIRTSYRKYYAWFVNELTMPENWPKDVGLESMFVGDRRGILVFEDATLEFIPDIHCPFASTGKGRGVLVAPERTCDFHQLISYGAPGTGKSWKTDKWIRENGIESFRTTFHPDSDYSTFVGAYKPTMKPEQRINCIDDKAKAVKDSSGSPSMHDVISYEFRPQAFILAYVAAWKKMAGNGERGMGNGAMGASHPTDVVAMNSVPPVALVIEEINRGNCAQIFGDIFQLLDRDESGWSSYPIDADTDLAKYLKGNLPDLSALACPDKMKPDDWDKVKVGEMLALPPNLYIHATMNTSDQSLFPIDSAFKRRWDWKYIPIAKPTEPGWVDRTIQTAGKKFDWWDFITIINECILDKTKSEDKQLGYFFVKAPDATGVITAEKFANKVLFYIYNDVFKDYDLPKDVFGKESSDGKYAFRDFFAATGDVDEAVIAEFLSHLKKGDKKIAVAEDAATETPPSAEAPVE